MPVVKPARSARARVNSTRHEGPLLRVPSRVQHDARDAVDAEPGMREAGVGVAHVPSAQFAVSQALRLPAEVALTWTRS